MNDEVETVDENSHVVHLWEPLKFEITERYNYAPTNIIFKLLSNILYYFIAVPILHILTKVMFGFEVMGRENMEDIDTGAISVSNHIHFLDCAMISLSEFPGRVYYTCSDTGFKMPVIRHLVKLLNGIPIPASIDNKKRFLKAIDNLLQDNNMVHVYPESSLWPYHNKLRNFKSGAFEMAVRNNVPIIPMVYTYREVTGIRKYIKRKPFISLNILPPIYPDANLDRKASIEYLKSRVYSEMENKVNE